jgi:uncharacterized protein involved in exopolysaccharide biosynthesis
MKQTTANSELEVVYRPAPSAQEPAHESREEATVGRLRLLWDKRTLLVRATALGFALAAVLAFILPKRYESTTQLMPPDDQSSRTMAMAAALGGRMPGGLGMLAGDVLGLKSSGDLFVGILRSRTIQDDLITKFDLRKVYSTKRWDSARKRLAASTVIAEDRKTGIIFIGVTDQSPDRAAQLAHEYITELNLVVSQQSTSSAHRERVFLEERLQQVKQDLESAEKEFSEFASKNTTIDIKEQGIAMVDSAAKLQGELIGAQSELEGLKQIYAEGNVRVRALRARIAELNSQLQKLGGQSDGQSTPADGHAALYPSIRKLPLLGVPYADLYRRTKVQESVYETLTQEYELAKVAEAREIPSVKVLDAPDVPEEKVFPPRRLIAILGALLAFLGCSAWILGKSRWDTINPESPSKLLAQDVFQTMGSYVPWGPNGATGGGLTRLVHRFRRNGTAKGTE